MKTHIFDGKKLALEKELELIDELKNKSRVPKIVSLLVGDSSSSKQFLSLKRKAAQRVRIKMDIVRIRKDEKEEVIKTINKLNKDKNIDGIMIQLPLPKRFSEKDRDEIIGKIAKSKDIDGMREDSKYLTPVVKAVIAALKEASPHINKTDSNVLVVGAKGFVGKKLVKVLEGIGYEVQGVDIENKNLKTKTRKADILVSATGEKALIKGNMVKKGAVLIDVGAPDGDILKEAYEKASFVSPVPGGVGPLTIYYLLENALLSIS